MVIEDIIAIVRGNVDDATADVDAAIDLAIKYLSSFFFIRKIDESQTLSTGDTSIAKPDRALKIINVKLGDEYIPKADLDKLQDIEDNNTQRWYIEDEFLSGTDNKIHLTKSISAADNGVVVKIWYLAGFTPLEGVALSNTDMPERIEPLIISFATYFYYGLLVSFVKNNKATFPNMTVWDVIAIWDTWRIHSFDLLEAVRKNHLDLMN